jgi:cell division septal protein FtsQ
MKNRKKSKPVSKKSDYKNIYYPQKSFPNQTKESQLLLKNIENKKRRVISSRTVLRKRHGIVKKILISLFISGLCIFLFIKFHVADYFKISAVNVTGSHGFVSAEDVRNLTEKNAAGKFIFSVNEEELSNILLKNFLGAKKIYVRKNYPNSLDVFIEERVPLAVVYNSEGGRFIIDSEGYVLGVVDENFSDLPEIKYEGSIMVGNFLERSIVPISTNILNFAALEKLRVSNMSFFSDYVRLYVNGGVEVYMDYDKDYRKSLKTVKALLKESDEGGKTLEKIDLRYDKVIVLYD